MINYGETIVIAAAKVEVAEPDVFIPDKGFIGKVNLYLRFF